MKSKKSFIVSCVVIFTFVFSLMLTGCSNSNTKSNEKSNTSNNESTNSAASSENKSDSGQEKIADASQQVLRFNIGGEPSTLHPQHSVENYGSYIVNSIHEGLVRYDKDKKLVPGMAKSWDINEDYTVYTFHLRDAKWEDGTPVTAQDFEYTYKKAVDPNEASEVANNFEVFKNGIDILSGKDPSLTYEDLGVKAIDDKTLELTFEKSCPYFLSMAALAPMSPVQKAAYEEYGENYGTDESKFVANGAFRVKEWSHEQKIVLEKNPNYWDADNIILEEIVFDMIADGNTRVSLFETDELDHMDVGGDYFEKYKDDPYFVAAPEVGVSFVEFNCIDKYFKNNKLRKAFSMAIDRKAYLDSVLKNRGFIPAYGFVPNGITGKSGGDFRDQNGNLFEDISINPDNKELANKLLDEGLAELGATREELQKNISYLTIDSEGSKLAAQAFQQMWKNVLGIEVQIQPSQVRMILERLNNHDYSMCVGGDGASYDDPEGMLGNFYSKSGNDCEWHDDEFDKLIEQSWTQVGDERMDTLMKAERIFVDGCKKVPVFFPSSIYITKPYVRGLNKFAVGVTYDFKWAYIVEH